MRCYLCGGMVLDPLYRQLHRKIGYRFWRCQVCRLIQAEQTVPLDEDERFYAEAYYTLPHKTCEYAGRVAMFDRLIERVERLTEGRDLLDLGCGPGDFVAAACRRGWRAEGVELSPQAVASGRSRHGVPLHVGSIVDWVGVGRAYDVVTFWNVLDQLPDPAMGLATARRFLRPGGWVVARVPNGTFHHAFRSLGSLSPGAVRRFRLADYFSVHPFSFTSATVTLLFRKNGFEAVGAENAPASDYDSARAWSWTGMACGLAFGLGKAVHGSSGGRLCWAPSLMVFGRAR